jgi:hypothetical protein
MTYAALTDLGEAPTCKICEKPIEPGQQIALVLFTTAVHDPAYNKEAELPETLLTASVDWDDQDALHAECFADELLEVQNH